MKKTHCMKSKFVAALTAVGLASLGCASSAEDSPISGDPGDRQVTAEVLMNLPDESGARTVKPLGSETFALADYASWDRALVVNGVETHDLAALRSGSEIVVPLNTGETATLVRRGDRLELESFTGEDDGAGESPRGAVGAVELLPAEYHVYLAGSDGSAPDTMVRLSGVEDLPEEAADLVTALALQTLLSTLEDTGADRPGRRHRCHRGGRRRGLADHLRPVRLRLRDPVRGLRRVRDPVRRLDRVARAGHRRRRRRILLPLLVT